MNSLTRLTRRYNPPCVPKPLSFGPLDVRNALDSSSNYRMAPITSTCPFCGAPLVSGYAEMRPSLLGTFFGGTGPGIMRFTRDLTEYDVLESGERQLAYACERCGAAVITDEQWTA